MIQTETRLRVADNSGAKELLAFVSLAVLPVSMRTSEMLSFALLRKQHQAAL